MALIKWYDVTKDGKENANFLIKINKTKKQTNTQEITNFLNFILIGEFKYVSI